MYALSLFFKYILKTALCGKPANNRAHSGQHCKSRMCMTHSFLSLCLCALSHSAILQLQRERLVTRGVAFDELR